jgi:CspA family cold shock protein
MTTGKIKTKTDKGFGFIAVEGSDDVFFHNSACDGQFDNLQIGQMVQFDVEKGEKGLRAVNVVVAKDGGSMDESMAA